MCQCIELHYSSLIQLSYVLQKAFTKIILKYLVVSF